MTKWYTDNSKSKGNDIDTPIIVGYDTTKDYSPAPICKWCRRDLITVNGGYLCPNCNIEFSESDEMRRKPRLMTSSGKDKVPYVKLIDANDRFLKKETEDHGAVADLSKKGTMHIMDYEERGGSGKILGTRKSNKSSKK
jgi:hypothetical protein